jgi:hypothetical protein
MNTDIEFIHTKSIELFKKYHNISLISELSVNKYIIDLLNNIFNIIQLNHQLTYLTSLITDYLNSSSFEIYHTLEYVSRKNSREKRIIKLSNKINKKLQIYPSYMIDFQPIDFNEGLRILQTNNNNGSSENFIILLYNKYSTIFESICTTCRPLKNEIWIQNGMNTISKLHITSQNHIHIYGWFYLKNQVDHYNNIFFYKNGSLCKLDYLENIIQVKQSLLWHCQWASYLVHNQKFYIFDFFHDQQCEVYDPLDNDNNSNTWKYLPKFPTSSYPQKRGCGGMQSLSIFNNYEKYNFILVIGRNYNEKKTSLIPIIHEYYPDYNIWKNSQLKLPKNSKILKNEFYDIDKIQMFWNYNDISNSINLTLVYDKTKYSQDENEDKSNNTNEEEQVDEKSESEKPKYEYDIEFFSISIERLKLIKNDDNDDNIDNIWIEHKLITN